MQAQSEIETAKSCKQSSWGQQFGRPTGWRGWAVGQLMALKNAGMSRLAVELMDIGPEDRVLEIGFGPGKAIAEAARRVSRGLVAGIDPSEVMLRQAERRNKRFIATGRVDLRQGSVSALPFEDRSFTRVFEVNSFHHWSSPAAGLAEIRRVMRDGGTLLDRGALLHDRGGNGRARRHTRVPVPAQPATAQHVQAPDDDRRQDDQSDTDPRQHQRRLYFGSRSSARAWRTCWRTSSKERVSLSRSRASARP